MRHLLAAVLLAGCVSATGCGSTQLSPAQPPPSSSSFGYLSQVEVPNGYLPRVDNILDWPSLTGAPPKAMTTTLVAGLSKLPEIRHLDNVEGITLGPKLSDGRQSVVLVTDDNFNAQQVTQFHASRCR